jgi:hypothetical protein
LRAKDLQNTTLLGGRPRSVLETAVRNGPLAVGKAQHYRPYKIPANHYIHGGAGDAVGILMGLAIGVVGSIAGFVTDDQDVPKAALHVFVAVERALDGRRP